MRADIRLLVLISLFLAIVTASVGGRMWFRGDPGWAAVAARELLERSTTPEEIEHATARILRATGSAVAASRSLRRVVFGLAISCAVGVLSTGLMLFTISRVLTRRGLVTATLAVQLVAGVLCIVAFVGLRMTQSELDGAAVAAQRLIDRMPAGPPASTDVLAASDSAIGHLVVTRRRALWWLVSESVAFFGITLLGGAAWRHLRANVIEHEGVILERI